MKEKYANLLLQALNLKDKKYLYIEIPSFLGDFKELLLESSKNYDLREVYVREMDVFRKHELMLTLDQENINKHPLFDGSVANKYAKLDAAFLFIQSSVPNLMDDIDPKKISETTKHIRSTQKYFRDLYETDKLNWCIAGVPNEYWAKSLNLTLDELWDKIFEVSLVDDETDAYQNWCVKLDGMKKRAEKLNNYNFDYLHYTNERGTDLRIYLPLGHIWCSGYGTHGEICNLPTEEIFTSPQYDKTEGVVYSTKPLFYNGVMIENFSLTFKEGKVVDYKAESGSDLLKTIIETDEFSGYLGECALVSYDSPINNTGILFKETLYDENASCHLALGMGFTECNSKANDKKGEDLRNIGVNDANIHVDFMVGDETLRIIGVTKTGEEILIMDKGSLVI